MARIFEAKMNRYRDMMNPLRGMTMARLVALLEAGERGQYSDLQWFYYFMERSDPTLYSVIHRRQSALLACDWDIRQVSGCRVQGSGKTSGVDQVLANEQVAFLREAYDRIDNFREAIAFLMSAVFRGFGHLEKHFEPSGMVARLEPVEQWFWVRDGLFGPWQYNQDAVSGRRSGQAINGEDFVIFETVALNRICSVPYVRKNFCEKDWDTYLAVYGVPAVFLIGPANVTTEKEKEYQAIAEEILSDGRGYLPNGADVKFVNGGGTKPPFIERIEYLDRQIVLAGTGGLLTMLAQAGSGTLAGGAHQDTFNQIAEADAAILSGVFQEQFDLPLLRAFYPDEEVLAYFEFAKAPGGRDANQVVQDVVALHGAGFELDPKEISEKTGYKVTAGHRDKGMAQSEVRGVNSKQ